MRGFSSGNVVSPSPGEVTIRAIMRHSKLDMTLYYSHSQRGQKRAALDRVAEQFVPKRARRELERELGSHLVQ